MKNDCARYKDLLLEAALAGSPAPVLAEHLRHCSDCANEFAVLRARQEKLDALLPLVVRGAEPSPGFRAQVLAATEAAGERNRGRGWRVLILAGAGTAIIVALTTAVTLRGKKAGSTALIVPVRELVASQKLAEWRAPTDVLLRTPGQEILLTTPRLGESYLKVSPKKVEEE